MKKAKELPRVNSGGQIDEYFKRKRIEKEEKTEQREETISKRSKKGGQTPEKDEIKKQGKSEMEDLVKMIKEWKAELKADIKEVKDEVKNGQNEVKRLREEIKTKEEKWDKEKQKLEERIEKLENNIEKQEKEKRKNNLIMTGLNETATDRESLKNIVERFLKNKLDIDTKIKTVQKIGQDKLIIEMDNWDEKMQVLKNKKKLVKDKEHKIYLDSDLTYNERKIQKKIRDYARIEKSNGANVKIRYQKLQINNTTLKWCHKEQTLLEVTEIESKN